mgnify:FL=1
MNCLASLPLVGLSSCQELLLADLISRRLCCAGEEGNVNAAQEALLRRAKANSDAQLGKYSGEGENAEAGKGMYEKGYTY